MSEQHHNESIIPTGEQRCVWMDAGLTSYQLCNRGFDCANCPVDLSMHMRFSAPATSLPIPSRDVLPTGKRIELPSTYLYTRDHWWMHHLPQQEESGCRLGIEPFLAQLLAYPKEIVLPQEGTITEAGAICAWIVLKGGTVPLRSPLAGTVMRSNRTLRDEPQLIVSDPLASGWLFDMAGRETNSPHTMDKRQAIYHYAKEKERFTTLLCNSLRRTALDVGTTLADGGSFVANLGDVIGHKKLFSIILEIVNA